MFFPRVLLCTFLACVPVAGRVEAVGLKTDEENARYLLEKGELSLLKAHITPLQK